MRTSVRTDRFSRACALALGLAVLGACRALVSGRTDPRAAEIRAACEAFAAERGVVGMSVSVIDDGRVVFDESFGFADREARIPAARTTLYRLGSISKPVCAAIAMQLVEERELDLDRPIGAYVADVPEQVEQLTLRQLLSHTSGVRHYRSDRPDNDTEPRTTREALDLFVWDPLVFEPVTRYGYSTHAFTLAVAAIESATGRSYVDEVRRRIRPFAPSLDCERAGDEKAERAALYDRLDSGEVVARPEREDNSWKYGGGGLESTARDLARFGQAMLDGCVVPERRRREMWRDTALRDGSASDYGLGWRLAPDGSAVYHSGSQQGCHAMLVLVPSARRVVAVMTNTLGCGAPELGHALRELLAPARAD
jgi:CubicO group peptidase (beta-lactamase class C family)